MDIFASVSTTFGPCYLAFRSGRLCALEFADGPDAEEMFLYRLRKAWPEASFHYDFSQVSERSVPIFGASKRNRNVDILMDGTPFQQKVWETLRTVPSGTLVSYEELAAMAGMPRATRAVASAVARNPISYIVPCHRVIRKSGAIGNYRWGVALKKALIDFESSDKLS